MTKNEIIKMLSDIFWDFDEILWTQYWNPEKSQSVFNRKGGDTLAQFVASEIDSIWDESVSEDENLVAALRAMTKATDTLRGIQEELLNALLEGLLPNKKEVD